MIFQLLHYHLAVFAVKIETDIKKLTCFDTRPETMLKANALLKYITFIYRK